jgi:5-methylcytosine-specific restriction endonuclease McrA
MTWGKVGRPQPPDWKRRKARILARDKRICYVCLKPGADEVDHVVSTKQGGNHEDNNLAAIHSRPCHQAKTQREAQAARITQRRPTERHPGLG